MSDLSDLERYVEKRCKEDEKFRIEYEAVRRFIDFLKDKYKDEDLLRIMRMIPLYSYEYDFEDNVLKLGRIKVKGYKIDIYWDDSGDVPMFCAHANINNCGLNTQAESVEELIENIKEVIQLCRESAR